MSSGHLPRYHVQEVAEAHTASTARRLDARILRSIPRTLGPRRLEGPLPTPTASWKSLRLRAICPQPQSLSSSHMPRSCFPESARLLSCFASVSIACPRAVNYKSGFSTVSSSQPGSGPSFSFVNEAKTGLFPGFVSCNAATRSLHTPPISQNPQLCLSLDSAPKGAENPFHAQLGIWLISTFASVCMEMREEGVSWNTPQQFIS